MPQIRIDTFPALVAIAAPGLVEVHTDLRSAPTIEGAYQIATCRVIVTEDRILIARDSSSGPKVVFSEAYDPESFHKAPNRAEDSHVLTLSGKAIAFRRDEQCGCGSRLRSWAPFKNNIVQSSKNPTK